MHNRFEYRQNPEQNSFSQKSNFTKSEFKKAVNLCKGKYFIRVDSDDFLNSHALEMMSKILDANEELAFVNCDHFRVDERGLKQKNSCLLLQRLNQFSKLNSYSFHFSNC